MRSTAGTCAHCCAHIAPLFALASFLTCEHAPQKQVTQGKLLDLELQDRPSPEACYGMLGSKLQEQAMVTSKSF